MTEPLKPRNRDGYQPEDLEQVKSALLTIALCLGSYLGDLCIVGGVVPALLIDLRRESRGGETHPGTNDLDIALALALLDDERYAEVSQHLRDEGFEPDRNEDDRPTIQRWKMKGKKVTVDFLIEPIGDAKGGGLKNLQADFGALVMPGLGVAFEDRRSVELDGWSFAGDKVRRTVPVCGPAAFTVLKALAFGNRAAPKDAFDLVYVIRHSPGSGRAIADRLAMLSDRDSVDAAIEVLRRDFTDIDSPGPRRAAQFALPTAAGQEELDQEAADALGFVDDLLRRWDELGRR